MNDTKLYAELERLAAAFPWQGVDIWTKRAPEGQLSYTAFLHANPTMGLDGNNCSCEHSPEPAVDSLIQESAHKCDPEKRVQEKIRELELQITKLRCVNIGLPPYVPCLQLGYSNPAPPKPPEAQAFHNIEASVAQEDVPF